MTIAAVQRENEFVLLVHDGFDEKEADELHLLLAITIDAKETRDPAPPLAGAGRAGTGSERGRHRRTPRTPAKVPEQAALTFQGVDMVSAAMAATPPTDAARSGDGYLLPHLVVRAGGPPVVSAEPGGRLAISEGRPARSSLARDEGASSRAVRGGTLQSGAEEASRCRWLLRAVVVALLLGVVAGAMAAAFTRVVEAEGLELPFRP